MFDWLRTKRISIEELEQLAERREKPAFHMVSTDTPLGRSQIGGTAPWPDAAPSRMTCMAVLDLSELARLRTLPWLPQQGLLAFFGDFESETQDERLPCAVVHGPATPIDGATPKSKTRFMVPREFNSLPSLARLKREAGPFRANAEDYEHLIDARYNGDLRHQVGGYPAVLQADDMEAMCSTHAQSSPGQSDEWVMLLQIDGEDSRFVPWTDWGTFYFWIRRSAAQSGDFSDVQLFYQTT